MRPAMRPARPLAAALAALALAAVPATSAGAQIAPGSRLVFQGSADATDIGAPGVVLDVVPRVAIGRTGNTGAFAALNGRGGVGVMRDLRVGQGAQSVRNLLTVGGYHFDLAHVPSGPYGQDECYVWPAPGQRCTPYQFPAWDLSPFYLENQYDPTTETMRAVVSFNVFGTVRGPGNVSSDFTGTITSIFDGVSFQEALSALETEGLRDVPFTGTFVAGTTVMAGPSSVVPEPSTWALLAGGLVGVAGVARSRRRR